MASEPGPAAIMERLSRMPARLAASVNAVEPARLDRRPRAGGLTAREVLALLADLELNVRWPAQAARILREDAPALGAVEPEVRALEHAYRNQDPRVAVGTYTMARKHLLAELAPLPAAAWRRLARDAGGGVLTLAAWLERLAAEDEAHLAAIEATLREA
jgi:acetyl-CoA carboxylase carboxyltransferase component